MRGSCNLYFGFVLLSLIFISSCNNDDQTVRDDQSQVLRPKVPIMGWASWNNYRVNINEKIIKAQADAIVETGLMNAGYKYINIDDGFFGGRDENRKPFSP